MDDPKRIPSVIRGQSPCADCTERFRACWDNCPKDDRGDYGYKAWKADVEAMKAKKKAYHDLNRRRRQWRKTIIKPDFKL